MQPGLSKAVPRGWPENHRVTGLGTAANDAWRHCHSGVKQQAVVVRVERLSDAAMPSAPMKMKQGMALVLPRRTGSGGDPWRTEGMGRPPGDSELCPVQQVRYGATKSGRGRKRDHSGDGSRGDGPSEGPVLGRQHHQQTARIGEHEQIGDKQEHRQSSVPWPSNISRAPQQAARQGAGGRKESMPHRCAGIA